MTRFRSGTTATEGLRAGFVFARGDHERRDVDEQPPRRLRAATPATD